MWQPWVAIAAAVAVLAVVFVALLTRKKRALPTGPIFALASALAVVGITFSDAPLIGYSFLGASIVLSVIYAVKSSRKK
jgi:phosphoglycerol transferase MdoB-like AlkP superfamily enzyme